MEKVDLFALIDELSEEIEMSPSRGLSKTKSIDAKIVMEIIDDIRKAAQDEFEYSSKVMHEREQIMAAANAQADEIIQRAKAEANSLVDENAITRAAYEKSAKLLETGKARAQAIRANADVYASEVLDEMEQYFKDYVDLIRENKSRLSAKQKAAVQQEAAELPQEQ